MEGGKMDRLVRTDGESDGRRWDKVISDKCVCVDACTVNDVERPMLRTCGDMR